jgi:molybdate-binding protein
MDEITHVDRLDQIRALGDPNRLAIVRLVLAGPATLSQLGVALGHHPAWVRHHVKTLEQAGLVELAETRKVGNYTEKYYRATARALTVGMMVLPQPTERGLIVIVGSDDLALALLGDTLHDDPSGPDVFRLAMGSLEGLIALRQGLGNVAGCHLLDPESGEFNLPHARHLFPGRSLALVTLAHREQGLIVAPGNPLRLTGLSDLAGGGATIVNRNSGSGTRVWIDRLLSSEGVPHEALRGYDDEVSTHGEVAAAVAEGRADAGIGILAAARRLDLGFVPLFEERYDLVVPAETRDSDLLRPLFERLTTRDFKRDVERLGGYRTTHTAEEILLAA